MPMIRISTRSPILTACAYCIVRPQPGVAKSAGVAFSNSTVKQVYSVHYFPKNKLTLLDENGYHYRSMAI